ncbi:MAG: uroporphyrinogen decarboxylase family protein [Gordonibacter sp.]|nr:uroporphyrinogen decarboxylase family protein [Gordonibacter sp.]
MIGDKENVLRYLKGQRYERDPGIVLMTGGDFHTVEHVELPICERPIHDEGYDVFGVHWTAAVPAAHYTPGQVPIYDDIENWRAQVNIPRVDRFDWVGFAAKASQADRENKIVTVVSTVGPFERVSCLTSFEDCLVNSMEDPEEFGALIGALADYKTEVIARMYDAAHPEVFMFHDDWGTSTSTFFAPDTWRALFKPHVKRICDAVLDRGMVCGLHSCGAISPLVGDIVDMGISFWEAQGECNDFDALRSQYPELAILATPPSSMVGGFLKSGELGPWNPAKGYAEKPAFLWE